MTEPVIFGVDESKLEEGVDKLMFVLERHVSYFAGEDGLNRLLAYLGDENPFCHIFQIIKGGFGKE